MTHVRIGKKIPPSFSMDLELAIPAGVTAVFGPAGAGKTLFLDLLAGFAMPDSGRILLEDRILFDSAARVYVAPHRRRCGYIPQKDSLFPHLTLRQNLAFAAGHLTRLERHRRTAEMLERFGLTAEAPLQPQGLTPDQRLRGETARLLLAEPRLILLDDRGWDQALLDRIRAASTAPIVVVSRNLDLCAAADTLVLLDRGRIVGQGNPRAILDAPGSREAVRLLGIPNLFEVEVTALDPGRNTSRLEAGGFGLTGPYLRGHFLGDRISIAIDPGDVRVHAEGVQPVNSIRVRLLRVFPRARTVRMEFEGEIFADVPLAEYARIKDNKKDWYVEFPPEALKVL
jgi:molybdate transport system ATP-binding protein